MLFQAYMKEHTEAELNMKSMLVLTSSASAGQCCVGASSIYELSGHIDDDLPHLQQMKIPMVCRARIPMVVQCRAMPSFRKMCLR